MHGEPLGTSLAMDVMVRAARIRRFLGTSDLRWDQ